ncbi:MAG: hypothetical protein HC852_21565 [Acaryochloridaceae cyanobacterium RU_4_10]|nr:hypothetical protein [Acaryochloridaceae cyanobacterium RU_4_10]
MSALGSVIGCKITEIAPIVGLNDRAFYLRRILKGTSALTDALSHTAIHTHNLKPTHRDNRCDRQPHRDRLRC